MGQYLLVLETFKAVNLLCALHCTSQTLPLLGHHAMLCVIAVGWCPCVAMQRGAGAWVQTLDISRAELPVQLAYEVFQVLGR